MKNYKLIVTSFVLTLFLFSCGTAEDASSANEKDANKKVTTKDQPAKQTVSEELENM